MVKAYLSVFSNSSQDGVFMSSSTTKQYRIGHDLVTRLFLLILAFFTRRSDLSYLLARESGGVDAMSAPGKSLDFELYICSTILLINNFLSLYLFHPQAMPGFFAKVLRQPPQILS
jgi:hypothetical protein